MASCHRCSFPGGKRIYHSVVCLSLFFPTRYLLHFMSHMRSRFRKGRESRRREATIELPDIRRNAVSYNAYGVLSYCHQIRSTINQISPNLPVRFRRPHLPHRSQTSQNAHRPILPHMQQNVCDGIGDEVPL